MAGPEKDLCLRFGWPFPEMKDPPLSFRLRSTLVIPIVGTFSKVFLSKELRTWFESMRTRFGKISERKSGAGAPPKLTERDQWIVLIFGFLQTHIVRQPTRHSAKFGKDANTSTSSLPTVGNFSTDEEEGNAVAPGLQFGSCSSAGTSRSGSLERVHKKKKTPSENRSGNDKEYIESIMARRTINDELRKKVSEMEQPKTEIEHKAQRWFSYMSTDAASIHPRVWDSYVQELLASTMKFKSISERIWFEEKSVNQALEHVAPQPATAQAPAPMPYQQPVPTPGGSHFPFPAHPPQMPQSAWSTSTPSHGPPPTPRPATPSAPPGSASASFMNMSFSSLLPLSFATSSASGAQPSTLNTPDKSVPEKDE